MFTGIVQGIATVRDIQRSAGLSSLTLEFPDLPPDLKIGDSIALNGACMTVTQHGGGRVSFDAMGETLALTTLSELEVGSRVNFEHAARFGDPIGGHPVSGHVHGIARLRESIEAEANLRLWFDLTKALQKYVFHKGYIAVDGASLTVSRVDDQGFSVDLIPETRRSTCLGSLQPGQAVNIEIDTQTQTIVDTLERLLPEYVEKEWGRRTGMEPPSGSGA